MVLPAALQSKLPVKCGKILEARADLANGLGDRLLFRVFGKAQPVFLEAELGHCAENLLSRWINFRDLRGHDEDLFAAFLERLDHLRQVFFDALGSDLTSLRAHGA